MKMRLLLIIGVISLGLEGCFLLPSEKIAATPSTVVETPAADPVPRIFLKSDDSENPLEQVRVTAIGYGAPPKKFYPENQRKLMAMRAAKLDAYRALAERIQGLHIWGGSTVGEMVLEQEQFQTMLDGFVLGARLLSVVPAEDGNYEAVVEAVVDQAFLNRVLEQRVRQSQAPVIKDKSPEKVTVDKPAKTGARAEGYSVGSQPNFYYSDAL